MKAFQVFVKIEVNLVYPYIEAEKRKMSSSNVYYYYYYYCYYYHFSFQEVFHSQGANFTKMVSKS